MRPAKVCARGKCGRWPPGLGGVGFSLWRCSVCGSCGFVSVVSVRGLRAGDQSVVYVGRRCAGWEGSVLGNPFRLGPGEAAGAASGRFRVWLRGVVAAGLAGSALSGGEAAAWAELVRLAAVWCGRGRRCGWRAGAVRRGGHAMRLWCGMRWCSWRVGGSGCRGSRVGWLSPARGSLFSASCQTDSPRLPTAAAGRSAAAGRGHPRPV